MIQTSFFKVLSETSMKDLISHRTAASCHQNTPQTPDFQQLPEDFLPGEYEYSSSQPFYSYWWCFWHLCLRCIRRVRLTPATTDSFGFHPNMISPSQLGGNILE